MFRIGEFSQLGRVSIRMLRHYDELGLLVPAQVDQFTSYRYYTLEQLPRLYTILALRDLGLSLDQISQLIKDELESDQLRELLIKKRDEVQRTLKEETEK